MSADEKLVHAAQGDGGLHMMPLPDTKPTLADVGYVLLVTLVIGVTIALGQAFVAIA